MPPFDEEIQIRSNANRTNKKIHVSLAIFLAFVACAFLGTGYVIGTAAAPASSYKRRYAGGIAWIVSSLAAAVAAGVLAWRLWKRQQARKANDMVAFRDFQAPPGEKGPASYESAVINNAAAEEQISHADHQLRQPTPTKQVDSNPEQNPFTSPKLTSGKQPRAEPTSRIVGDGSIELQLLQEGPPRSKSESQRPHTLTLPRSGSQSWQNMMVANYVGDGNSLPRTPVTIRSQRSSIGQDRQPGGRNARVSTDPAAYFRDRSMTKDTIRSATSDETVTPNLMPPRIDSEFWRSVERSTLGQDDKANSPASPTPGSRDSFVAHPPRQSSLQQSINDGDIVSSGTPATSSEAGSSPTCRQEPTVSASQTPGDGSRRSSVVHDGSSVSRLSRNIVFPKRLSSLGAPTGLTSSMLSSISDDETVPHFSVLRTPSRPTSMMSLNEHDRSVSPVLALYAEMNNSSNTSLEDLQYGAAGRSYIPAAKHAGTVDQAFGSSPPHDEIRPASSTLPRPGTLPSLQITETPSDNEPFPYDHSKFSAGARNVGHAMSVHDRHGESDDMTPIARSFPPPMTPSGSMMSIMTLKAAPSPASSFEPSLYSSQINLRAAESSRKLNSPCSTPTKRSFVADLSSRKTSTDRLSFKSAKTTQTQLTENEDDDTDEIGDRRIWSGVNLYHRK